jgi:chemotaxis response regulator CheB
MPVAPDHVYLIPAKKEMIISGGRLLLSERDRQQELTLPIDVFFRSLAQDCGGDAIAIVLSEQGHQVALGCVFVALVGSFLVSYTRAKAESLGLRGEAGLMSRAERVVLVAAVLPFAGHGSLPYGIYVLAALTTLTVIQRIVYVRRQLLSEG